jgi:hypothetical protein
MSLRKVFPQLLDTTGASDGQVLRYVEANSRVEFVTATIGGSSDTVQDNLNRLSANVTANVGLVSDNVDSASSNVTALSTNIDTVSGNVDSYATYANSAFGTVTGFTFAKIAVGTVGNVEANVASDQLTLVAGNNITINADAATDTLTFKAALSNAVNNYFIADGTTNAFTLTQAASSNLDVLVSVEGLIQSPNLHYQVESTTLTLMNTLPLENGTEVMVRWIPNTAESASSGTSYTFQGSSFGYASGGSANIIDKFPFSSDTNATDVGDLTVAVADGSESSSSEHGYVAGGLLGSTNYTGTIQRFSFLSDGNASDIGSLINGVYSQNEGQSSGTHGYASGGRPPNSVDFIEKYEFASSTNGIDVGELSVPRTQAAGQSSTSHGYVSGGHNRQTNTTLSSTEKFSFSSDSSGSSIGNLTSTSTHAGGVSSSKNGYTTSGRLTSSGSNKDTIDKFPFSSDTNATDVAELAGTPRRGHAGHSSTTHGYISGGATNAAISSIRKFEYANEATNSEIGFLTSSTSSLQGHQI